MISTNIGTAHTIYGYFRRWRQVGVWGRVLDTLRQWERQRLGRLPKPSACCANSQSMKTVTQGKDIGFNGNKKITGRKRHILVDPFGLIIAGVVTTANRDDQQAQ
jgi:putative transposase